MKKSFKTALGLPILVVLIETTLLTIWTLTLMSKVKPSKCGRALALLLTMS